MAAAGRMCMAVVSEGKNALDKIWGDFGRFVIFVRAILFLRLLGKDKKEAGTSSAQPSKA
jgi:hypothetical protein